MTNNHNADHLVAGRYSIEDLVDLTALERIFTKFSTATGFTTGFLAYPAQKILIKTGWRDACVKFHRACPASAEACKESNVELSQHLKDHRQLRIRQCRMGLVDGATPIIVRGVYCAYLATGQVFFQPPDLDRYRGYARQFGYDEAEYLRAIQAVPVVAETQFRAVLEYLSHLATEIAEQGLMRLEKHEQYVQLRESEVRFRALFEQATDGMLLADTQTKRLLMSNRRIQQLLGYTADELLQLTVPDIHPPAELPQIMAIFASHSRGDTTQATVPMRRKDGTMFYADLNVSRMTVHGRECLLGSLRDITVRQRAEAALRDSALRIQHLNDVLRSIQSVDNLILQERDSQKLLQAACEILVRTRGYVMVWVGQPVAESKRVVPIARAGVGAESLDHAPITWDDTPSGRGPSGTAIREQRAVVINDIRTDPTFALWRKPVEEYGALSIASVPLLAGAHCLGALTVKAGGIDAFDPDEVELLRTVAKNLAQALQAIADEAGLRKSRSELAEREEQYRSLFEHMFGGFILLEVIMDAAGNPVDHRLLDANPDFERMTGLKRSEEIGRTSANLSFQWPADVAQRYYQVALGGAPFHGERFNDTLQRHYEMRVFSPRKGQFAVVFADITDRKQAEAASRASEARYRTLLAHVPQFIFIKDQNFRYVSVNGNIARDLGRRLEDIVGKDDYDFYPREIADQHRAADQRLLATGNIEEFEDRGVRDGKEFWIHFIKSPVRDDTGAIIGIFGIYWDITARKQAERELAESEAKFRSLHVAMNEGVALHELVTDAAGHHIDYVLLDVNPAFEAILGLPRAAVIGRRASVVYGTGVAPYLDTYAQVVSTGQPVRFETAYAPLGKAFSISAFAPAPGRFDRTSTISAGKAGSAAASSSAAMLEPRPDTSTAVRMRAMSEVQAAGGGHRSAGVARRHHADHVRDLPRGCECRTDGLDSVLGHDRHHADAAVEGAQHFALRHAARRCQPAEHGQDRNRAEIKPDTQAVRQHPWNVVGKAATGDVGEGLDALGCLQHGQDRLHIDPGGLEQGLAQAAGRIERRGSIECEAAGLDDAPHQREAVGVHAGRRQAEQHVACGDPRAWQQCAAFRRTDGETGEVIVAAGVKAGHLGGLAADERAAGFPAACGDAGHDLGADMRRQLSGGEIIEEEQRLGALDDEVVDAHGHQIDADGGVPSGLDRDLDLGADTVIGRHQHRVAEARRLEVEQSTKAADLGVGAGAGRGPDQRLDRLDHGIASVDIDARLRIGEAVGALAVAHAHADRAPTCPDRARSRAGGVWQAAARPGG